MVMAVAVGPISGIDGSDSGIVLVVVAVSVAVVAVAMA